MINLNNYKIWITFLNNDQIFKYIGNVISENEDFICIDDEKVGTIWINKRYILNVRLMDNGA